MKKNERQYLKRKKIKLGRKKTFPAESRSSSADENYHSAISTSISLSGKSSATGGIEKSALPKIHANCQFT